MFVFVWLESWKQIDLESKQCLKCNEKCKSLGNLEVDITFIVPFNRNLKSQIHTMAYVSNVLFSMYLQLINFHSKRSQVVTISVFYLCFGSTCFRTTGITDPSTPSIINCKKIAWFIVSTQLVIWGYDMSHKKTIYGSILIKILNSKYIPGHVSVLRLRVCNETPVHWYPTPTGRGLVNLRLLFRLPPPQLLVHWEYAPQSLHPKFTVSQWQGRLFLYYFCF